MYKYDFRKNILFIGCDSGFGHSLAQRLDELGLHVFAGCLFPNGKGASTLRESASSKLHIVPIDVTSDESIEKALIYVTEKLKDNKLWALVNNAGINEGGEIFWTNNDIIKKVIDVNIFGVVKVTKAFLPLLVRFKGRVVTVASAAGRYTYPGLIPYCMSKHAVISFCDGLRFEMYRFGVKVVIVEPYLYKTVIINERIIQQYINKTWDKAPAKVKEFFTENFLQSFVNYIIRFSNNSSSDKPQQVIECLEEGILSQTPKYYYSPGTFYSRFWMWIFKRIAKPFSDLLFNDEFRVPTC